MKNKSSLTVLLLLLATAARAEVPPHDSWEHWIAVLRQHPKKLPRRPDGLSLESPLPAWVDCHLSWAFEHQGQSLPHEIVLRADATHCAGQLEEWAGSNASTAPAPTAPVRTAAAKPAPVAPRTMSVSIPADDRPRPTLPAALLPGQPLSGAR